MIRLIVVSLFGIIGENIEGGVIETDLELLRDSPAFYPMPELTVQQSELSTLLEPQPQGAMNVYFQGAEKQNTYSQRWSDNSWHYYPMDKFMTQKYNLSGVDFPEVYPSNNQNDPVWFRSVSDSVANVVKNQYFQLPERKPYNTTIEKPVLINPFFDIFNRNNETEEI